MQIGGFAFFIHKRHRMSASSLNRCSDVPDTGRVRTSHGRIVIISDTHLGRPGKGAGSADRLRPLWRGASRLIVNGDVAEVADARCRGEAARQVLRLQELCEHDGVEVTFLSGNHDPHISDRRMLRLFGGEVFITHGDVLHPSLSPWNGHAAHLGTLHAGALASVASQGAGHFEARFAAAQHASHLHWDELAELHERQGDPAQQGSNPLATIGRFASVPGKAARVLWYWQTLPRRAAAFAHFNVPECRYFIFGHYHRAGVWHDRGRVVINTGAYAFPARPRCVVIDRGELAVWPVTRRDDLYTLGDAPIAGFEIYNRAAA